MLQDSVSVAAAIATVFCLSFFLLFEGDYDEG